MAKMEGPMHASKMEHQKKDPKKIWFFFLQVPKSPPRAYYWGQKALFLYEREQKAFISTSYKASYSFFCRGKINFFLFFFKKNKSMIPLYGLLLEKQKKVCSGLGFFFWSYMQ